MAPCIPALQGGFASPGPPAHPAPHSYAGQLPCGAGAPRAICPAECACARNSRCHYRTRAPLPPPPLRRMCRRQSPASHASTHITPAVVRLALHQTTDQASLGRSYQPIVDAHLAQTHTARSKLLAPHPFPCPQAHRKPTDGTGTTHTVAQGCKRFAHIAFLRTDHPKAPWPRVAVRRGMRCRMPADKGTLAWPGQRELCAHWRSRRQIARRRTAPEGSCRRRNAAQDDSGFQGAEPLERGDARGHRSMAPCPSET